MGMSLSSLPSAPGAPFGQSGIGSFTSARNRIAKESSRADATRVFMVDRTRSIRRLATLSMQKSAERFCQGGRGVGPDWRKIMRPRIRIRSLMILPFHRLEHKFEILTGNGVLGIDAQSAFKMEHRAICLSQFGKNKSEVAVGFGVVGVDANHVFIFGDRLGQFLL